MGPASSFPAVLQEKVRRANQPFEVVNAGVSRETSTDALARLDTALAGDVRVLVLALGANDGFRGVPVAKLKANLTRIIEAAQARRIAVLLCAMEALPLYGWDYTVAFHELYIDLARRYQLPLVPFVMMNLLANPQMLLPDRIHPNAAGARAIADLIWPHLEPMLAPAMAPSP
jgi:acyl-CoA thioesterase-1